MISKQKNYLLILGIMTGNSLDACDVVLTKFYSNGKMEDISFHSKLYSNELYDYLQDLRRVINDFNGDMQLVVKDYEYVKGSKKLNFDDVNNIYLDLVNQAINELVKKSDISLQDIDLIGFHGQTCAHNPPSIINSENIEDVYTVQIGDGQKLADLTGIAVAYDFRSDDIMFGGEGAPLAPMHNKHIADHLQSKGIYSVAFLNGGNTSNISVISKEMDSNNSVVLGWDAGPFNHFPDSLVRKVKGISCDYDGEIGYKGKVNNELLEKLFHHAVIDKEKNNFLLKVPPKSSDPSWYEILPELLNDKYSFEDRVRTVEYFSAYTLFHTLHYIPSNVHFPTHFLIFGGGWKNKAIFNHFETLLKGDFVSNFLIPEHVGMFDEIYKRLKVNPVTLKRSDEYGFNGEAMEARLIADLARCLVCGIPFSTFSTTGVKSPKVLGILKFPNKDMKQCTSNLQLWMNDCTQESLNSLCVLDSRFSRASKGWASHY